MNFGISRDDLAFASEVRAFIAGALPEEIRTKVRSELRLTRAEMTSWQRRLFDQGWVAPAWPRDHGGTGWSLARQYVFKRELGLGFAPDLPAFGLQMIGPVLYTFASQEQKQRYLPGILTGETWWCQGFSEPNAGSDLASLKTRATLDGNHYVVSGQKIWTSLAHLADMMFCLVRTESTPKPQACLSLLLLDMRSPGVTVRPIITLDGHHHLNEVFLDAVRVPQENLVGEPGRGWTYAKFLLGHERIGIANIPRLRRRFAALLELGAQPNCHGRAALADPAWRRRIADYEIDLKALEATELATLRRAEAGAADAMAASVLKVAGTELLQRADTLLWDLMGAEAAVLPTDAARRESPLAAVRYGVTPALLHGRAASIYGGSNEIQRNIMAGHLFGPAT